MKKIMLVLSLAFFAMSFQAKAATLSWISAPNATGHVGDTTGSAFDGLLGTYKGGIAPGTLHDSWVFNIAGAPTVHTVMSVQEFINKTVGMTVKLDGALISFDNTGLWSFDSFLSAGNHTISLDGTVKNITSGTRSNVNISIGTVPVPAAFWLFGSVVLGMFGFKSRNRSTSAYPVSA